MGRREVDRDQLQCATEDLATERQRAEAAEAENKKLRGLLWYAWSEMNAIRAESGVPRDYDGKPKAISEDHWSNIVDAMADALGDEAKPWPSDAARAALQSEEK